MAHSNHSEWHTRQAVSAASVAARKGEQLEMDFAALPLAKDWDVHSDNYASLQAVLDAAYAQAAHGKGAERHARGNPFEEQHMQTISRLLGTERGMAFQAIKKLTEGLDMADPDARERELLGAINYLAGIVVYFRAR